MNIAFFKWAVVLALVTSIASLAGLLHNKKTVAQAECRRQCGRQRDSVLAQIQMDRSTATLHHYQRLLAFLLENVDNQSAIDQGLSSENTRFSQELQELATRSVAAATHGLTCIQSNAPFLFVSGITDRIGYFHDEVDPHPYT